MASNNKSNNVLAGLAMVVVVLSLISVGVSFYKFNQFNEKITGFASGYVNLTVTTANSINMTDDRVNWSSGTVNATEPNATLITYNRTAVVTRGNWSTAGVNSMIIQNNGNTNCTLTLLSDKNASILLGSLTNTSQSYQWNVSNNEALSCINTSINLTKWYEANLSTITLCAPFVYHDTRDEVLIDIALTVPPDTQPSYLGVEKTATITFLCG